MADIKTPQTLNIAHLGDVHIQDRRRDEYAAGFAKMYDMMRKDAPNIIVLAGDVFDTKIRSSAHNQQDVARLLTALSDIAPVIMIAGNHDTDIKSPGALDLLTPVVEDNKHLQPPKLTYYRNSGIYVNLGHVWVIVAPDGERPERKDIDATVVRLKEEKKIRSDALVMCIFHEEVSGAILPNGIKWGDTRVTTPYLSTFDASFGAHIHKRQGGKRWAYCSSTFQQNAGESHHDHGYLLWKITPSGAVQAPHNSKPPERVERVIPNPRGFIDFNIVNGEDVTVAPMPTHPYHYRIFHDGSTASLASLDSYKEYYMSAYGMPPRVTQIMKKYRHAVVVDGDEKQEPVDEKRDAIDEKDQPDAIADAQQAATDIAVHIQIIRSILDNEDSKLVEHVIAMHKNRFEFTPQVNGQRSRPVLIKFEFSNLYGLGTGNVIDFPPLEGGLCGIVAPNASGKSGFIDALTFAMFDICPRTGKKEQVMHIDAKSYILRLEFKLGDIHGVLTKEGFRANHSDKYRLEFGTNPPVTGIDEVVRKTAEIFGSYHTSCLTAIAHSHGQPDFMKLSALERKKALADLLQLGSFGPIEKKLKLEITAVNGGVKALKPQAPYKTSDQLEAEAEEAEGLANDDEILISDYEKQVSSNTSAIATAFQQQGELKVKIDTVAKLLASLPESTPINENARAIFAKAMETLKLPNLDAVKAEKSKMHGVEPNEINAAVVILSLSEIDALRKNIQPAEIENKRALAAETAATTAHLKAYAVLQSTPEVDPPEEAQPPEPEAKSPWPSTREGPRPSATAVAEAATTVRKIPAAELANYRQAIKVPSTEIEGEYAKLAAQDFSDAAEAYQRAQAAHKDKVNKCHEAQLNAKRTTDIHQKMTIAELCSILEFDVAPTPVTLAIRQRALEKEIKDAKQQADDAKGRFAASKAGVLQYLQLSDSCTACVANRAMLSDGKLADAATAASVSAAAVRDKYAAGFVLAHRLAENAVRIAAADLKAADSTQAKQTRLAALNAERKAKERYHIAHAVEILENAAFWWHKDVESRSRHRAALKYAQVKATEASAAAAAQSSEERALATGEELARVTDQYERARTARRQMLNFAICMASEAARADAERKTAERRKTIIDHTIKSDALRADIQTKQDEIAELKNAIAETQTSVVRHRTNAAVAREKCAAETARASRAADAEGKLEILKAYQTVLRPNKGIADALLERSREALEQNIRDALAETGANFSIRLSDKYDIEIQIKGVDKYIPAKSASGYQSFALSMAVRTALWRLTELPLPNCLIIDEGFGCCDPDNLYKIGEYMEAAAQSPDAPTLTMIVSHLDDLKMRLETRQLNIIVDPTLPSRICNGTASKVMIVPKLTQEPTAVEVLPPDEKDKSRVWCAACNKSLPSGGWAIKHLATATHRAHAEKAAARNTAAAVKAAIAAKPAAGVAVKLTANAAKPAIVAAKLSVAAARPAVATVKPTIAATVPSSVPHATGYDAKAAAARRVAFAGNTLEGNADLMRATVVRAVPNGADAKKRAVPDTKTAVVASRPPAAAGVAVMSAAIVKPTTAIVKSASALAKPVTAGFVPASQNDAKSRMALATAKSATVTTTAATATATAAAKPVTATATAAAKPVAATAKPVNAKPPQIITIAPPSSQ